MPIRFALIRKLTPALRVRFELPSWTFRMARLVSRQTR